MHTQRCVACETSHMVTMRAGDWWCVFCLAEGRQAAFAEASALVASIVAARHRSTHDLKAGAE
jgi:hypothetical protein